MAKRDVIKYYATVCKQYSDMLDVIHEYEDYVSQNIVGPERVDELKKQIEPLMNNYERLSWIVFLLDKPGRVKSFVDKVLKKLGYKTKTEKLKEGLKQEHSPDAVKRENKAVIDGIRESIK